MSKYIPLMRTKFNTEVVPSLHKHFQYKSVMQVPRLLKIVCNQGVGAATSDKKVADIAADEMTTITGQKALVTRSKKDISNFKLRSNMPIGCMVTLRGDRMYEFLERLIAVALPRVRDFKGINDKSFDGRGNYTLGITEQIIFPEIDIEKISRISGMDITFVTSAKTDREGLELLKAMGMPFKNQIKMQPADAENN
jgi:large subunit ribosomal protein L5